MKKIILITACLLLSTVFVKANFVMHSFAKNAVVSKKDLQQCQKPTKKIVDSLQYNPCNKDDLYTKYISLNTRDVFEKSVARQLKAKNKLNTFTLANINRKKSIDDFTRDNIGIFINAFIEAVDYCIPTNKYTGLKDQTQATYDKVSQIDNIEYIAYSLRDKYPEECWNYAKSLIYTYDNNFNFKTNPAPIKVIQGIIRFNNFITNKLINDENFFQEFRKYYIYHMKKSQSDFGMMQPLDEAYSQKTTAELGLLLKEDWKENYFDGILSREISGRYTEEGYQLYERNLKKEMATWNPKKESYKKNISSFKYMIKEQRKRVDKHERLRKEAEKGKSEEQVFAEYTADLRKKEKDLIKMSLNSESKIKLYFAQLKNAQELTEKYPKGYRYFHTGDCTRKIVKEAKPEFKEVYWQYMNEKQEDNQEDKLAQIIAGTAGAAFGKVMTEEDLPRAFDYVNKQRSFKLIDLLSFYKKTPPLAHKSASISMLLELSRNNRTNLVVYFIKRYKKIKDPQLRRGFLEMAPEFGLTNYPKPFYP